MPGRTLAAVQKAIATGRISPLPDGTIDVRSADAAWSANTTPTSAGTTTPAPAQPSVNGANAATEFNASRARKENALAGLRETELAQKRGELITVEDSVALLAETAERMNAILESWPVRNAHRLKLPVGEAHELLQGLVDEMQAELSALYPEEED